MEEFKILNFIRFFVSPLLQKVLPVPGGSFREYGVQNSELYRKYSVETGDGTENNTRVVLIKSLLKTRGCEKCWEDFRFFAYLGRALALKDMQLT
ncbi:MAG: hypothetical protein K9J83_04520 [Desulfarculaceae bacterium]|nr:hypothetical protein [Desulfarculaceae bacterium]